MFIHMFSYSSGEVRLWDTQEDEDCLFSPSSTALLLDEASTQGTVPNYVTSLATGTTHTAAFFKKGAILFISFFMLDQAGTRVATVTIIHECQLCQKLNFNEQLDVYMEKIYLNYLKPSFWDACVF